MGLDVVREVIAGALLVIGTLFMLLAGLGIYRMPDLYLRMSTTSKAATLGALSVLLAVAVAFNNLEVTSRAVAAIAFILLTAPVAAHMISRAAYLTDVPLWTESIHDDLRGKYDRETHHLASGLESE